MWVVCEEAGARNVSRNAAQIAMEDGEGGGVCMG
jgi:hypothetical protein